MSLKVGVQTKYNYNVLRHSFERLCYSTNLDFFKGNIIHSIAGCMNIIIPKFKLILYTCQFENEKNSLLVRTNYPAIVNKLLFLVPCYALLIAHLVTVGKR